MTDQHDESFVESMGWLEAADPVLSDPIPTVGSTRFTSIKENAMTGTATSKQAVPERGNHRSSRRPIRRSRLLAGAAAILVALVVGASLPIPGSTSSAAADVRAAVANSAAIRDFRVTLVSEGLGFPGGRAEGEVDGENLHLVAGSLEFYRVGDTEWIGQNGVFQSMPNTEQFDPFGEASAAVLTAALASDEVDDLGEEALDGVVTTRYVIRIDGAAQEALAAVPPTSQYWFIGNVSEEVVEDESDREPRRFGFLEDAESIDVWVADGLIHRIAVESGLSPFTWTFSDFGEDITITPPS